MNTTAIKEQPELRHFLRHLLYAIEELALGHTGAALYEVAQIEGMVSWGEDDAEFRKFCERRYFKWQKRKKAKRSVGKRPRNKRKGV